MKKTVLLKALALMLTLSLVVSLSSCLLSFVDEPAEETKAPTQATDAAEPGEATPEAATGEPGNNTDDPGAATAEVTAEPGDTTPEATQVVDVSQPPEITVEPGKTTEPGGDKTAEPTASPTPAPPTASPTPNQPTASPTPNQPTEKPDTPAQRALDFEAMLDGTWTAEDDDFIKFSINDAGQPYMMFANWFSGGEFPVATITDAQPNQYGEYNVTILYRGTTTPETISIEPSQGLQRSIYVREPGKTVKRYAYLEYRQFPKDDKYLDRDQIYDAFAGLRSGTTDSDKFIDITASSDGKVKLSKGRWSNCLQSTTYDKVYTILTVEKGSHPDEFRILLRDDYNGEEFWFPFTMKNNGAALTIDLGDGMEGYELDEYKNHPQVFAIYELIGGVWTGSQNTDLFLEVAVEAKAQLSLGIGEWHRNAGRRIVDKKWMINRVTMTDDRGMAYDIWLVDKTSGAIRCCKATLLDAGNGLSIDLGDGPVGYVRDDRIDHTADFMTKSELISCFTGLWTGRDDEDLYIYIYEDTSGNIKCGTGTWHNTGSKPNFNKTCTIISAKTDKKYQKFEVWLKDDATGEEFYTDSVWRFVWYPGSGLTFDVGTGVIVYVTDETHKFS